MTKSIYISRTHLPPLAEYNKYLKRIWKTHWLTNDGELVRELEKKFKKVTHKWIYKQSISLFDCLNYTNKTPCASGNYLFTRGSWLKAGRYNESTSIIAIDSWAFGFNQLATGAKMITLPNTFYYHRYGYESTYIKEIKKINPSLVALQVIIPYLHLIDKKDIEYILSDKNRYSWFENTNNPPIKFKKA